MKTLHSERQHYARIVAALMLALLPLTAVGVDQAVGSGAATAGGGVSTGGVYVNQAALGQVAGPVISGGVYQISSGFQSGIARTGEPRITRIIRAAGGRFRLRVTADAGAVLHLESSSSIGADAVWRREGAAAIGNGTEVELESDPSLTPARFYRVRLD
jgi:hypothetical protein